MEYRIERVRIHTDRFELVGDLTLPSEGYRSRLTDFLNAVDQEFLALTDVVASPWDGGEALRHDFAAVARGRIVFCAPVEDSSSNS